MICVIQVGTNEREMQQPLLRAVSGAG